jgi:peptide/nickel transport system permease protein
MFIVKKLVAASLVLLGVVCLIFILFQFIGDPSKLIVGQTGDKKTIANIRKELQLDEPKWKQLVYYLNNVSPISIYTSATIEEKNIKGYFIGDKIKMGIKIPYFGKSYQSKKLVSSIILEALPGTILLAITAMLIASLLGIGLGILAAIKQNTWIDNATIMTSTIGISVPSFFMAILIAYTFGILLHTYTGLNFSGSLFELDEITGDRKLMLQNLILPAITLGIRPLAIIMQLTRSSMLDVLKQDYIRTATAKGLNKRQIIFKHAIRNALNPIVTTISTWFAELLAGAFFVEFIYGWKGLGKITIDALDKLDYPVILGTVITSASIFVFINALTDILYQKIDPRIKNK